MVEVVGPAVVEVTPVGTVVDVIDVDEVVEVDVVDVEGVEDDVVEVAVVDGQGSMVVVLVSELVVVVPEVCAMAPVAVSAMARITIGTAKTGNHPTRGLGRGLGGDGTATTDPFPSARLLYVTNGTYPARKTGRRTCGVAAVNGLPTLPSGGIGHLGREKGARRT